MNVWWRAWFASSNVLLCGHGLPAKCPHDFSIDHNLHEYILRCMWKTSSQCLKLNMFPFHEGKTGTTRNSRNTTWFTRKMTQSSQRMKRNMSENTLRPHAFQSNRCCHKSPSSCPQHLLQPQVDEDKMDFSRVGKKREPSVSDSDDDAKEGKAVKVNTAAQDSNQCWLGCDGTIEL